MGYNSKQLKVQYHTKDAPNPKPNPYKGDKQVNPLVNKSYIDPTGNGMRDPRIKALAQQFGIPITIPGQSMGTNGYGNDMPLRVTPNYADGSQGPEYIKYPNTGDHSFPGAVSFTERSMASGGQTNSDIARAILKDGMVYGYSLSDSQREHMAEQAGYYIDENGDIVEAEDADDTDDAADDDSEMEYARRGGQKRKRKKTSSNPVTGINDLMIRNETIYGKSGKRRFVPKLQQGGWLDKYQDGGTVSELWEQKTGTPWSEAKKQGLTDGSYEGNMKVKDMLVKGNVSKPKPKVINKQPRGPRIDPSLMGQPNYKSESVQSQAPMSKYAAAEQNKAAVKNAIEGRAETVYNQHLQREELKKKYPTKNQEEIQRIQDKIESPLFYEPAGQLASYITRFEGLSEDELARITGSGTMGDRLGIAAEMAAWGLANEVGGALINKGLKYASPYIKKGLNTAGKVLNTSFDVTKSVPIVYRNSQFKNKLTIGSGKSKQTFNNSIEWKKALDAERAAGVERPLLKKEIKDRGILEIDRRHPLDPRQPLVKRGLLPEDYNMKKAVKEFIPNLIKGDVKSQYTMGIGRENAFNQYLRMPTKNNMYRVHPESFTKGNEMIYTVPHNKLVQLSKANAKTGVFSYAPSKASMQELQIAKESLTNNSKKFNKKAYDVVKKRMEQSYDKAVVKDILGPKNEFIYDITNPEYGADMAGGMSRIKNGTSYINDLDLYTNAHGNAYWENKNIPGSRNQSWKMIDTWDINPFSRMTDKPKWVQKLDVAPIMGAKNFTLNLDYITTPSGITKPLIPKKLGGWLDQYQDGGAYNMERALELGYTPDETGHWPSVDYENGMWLKSKEHPTAWMEYMYGHALNPELNKNTDVIINPEGYFGNNQLQYVPKKKMGGWLDKYQPGGPNTPQLWEKDIRDAEQQIGNPSQWDMQGYNLLQNKLNDYKNWRENTPEGRAVHDSHNEPNEYIVPLPFHLQYPQKMKKGGGLDQYQTAGQVPKIDPSLMGTPNFASETIRIPESLKEDPFVKAKRIADYNNKKNTEKKALAEKYYNERKNQKMIGVKGTPEELDKINKDVAEYSASNNVDNSRIPLSERVGDFATDMALNLIGTGAYTSLGKRFSALAKDEQVASGLSKFIPKELPGSPNAWKPPTKPLIIKNEADEIIYQYDPADYQNFNTPEMYNQAKNDLQFVVQRDSKKELERMAMLEKYGIKTEGDFQQYQRKLDTDLIKYNNDMGTDLNVRNPNPTQADMFTGSTDVPSFNQKIKELKAVGEHGKQPLLTKENFYNQADVTKMTQQHQDYYKALDEYEKLNPQTGADMFMGAFNGNNPYMETFHNLNPNLQAPKWGEKFWGNLDDTKMLNETLPYAPGVNNSLSPSSLKYMGSSENKLLPNAKNLVNRSDDWFHKASKRDYLMEMRGSLGLKPSDIKNMSNAEIELNAQKIYDKIGKQEVERYLKDVSTPYTGKQAYKTLTPNKFGGKTGGWLDNYK